MTFAPTRPFVPMRGLESPHAQTVFASVARTAKPAWRRQVLGTPDGDFLDLYVGGEAGTPLLLLLHGLEGSASSGYLKVMAHGALERGWAVAAVVFRSCGRPNKTLRGYHSGEWTDPAFVLTRLRNTMSPTRVFAAGFSLGGSVLLNLLTEGPPGLVDAAVAVSVPFDLLACVRAVDSDQPWQRVYRGNFLHTMRDKALKKAARFPGTLDVAALKRAKTIQDIDRLFTAPAFGFRDEYDYYGRSSTGRKLPRVRTPTLLISAEDDPLAPASMIPEAASANEHLSIVRTAQGGHVGFVEGTMRKPGFWAEEQALEYLAGR